MKSKSNSFKTLVLIGGHMPHIQAIKRFAENPVNNLRLVVIAPYSVCPYPPMLAEFLSGNLEFSRIHLDLQGMCIRAGFTFISSNIDAIDPSSKKVHLPGRPPISYDLISIAEFGESVPTFSYDAEKLIQMVSAHRLIEGWRNFLIKIEDFESIKPPRIAVVGDGSRAAEMAFVLHKVLREKFKDASIDLLSPSQGFSFSENSKVTEKIESALEKIGVQFHTEMELTSYIKGVLTTKDRKTRNFDFVFWAGEIKPLPWMGESKFKLSENGKFKTDRFARLTKEEGVFAAGDYAEQLNLRDNYEQIYAENLRRASVGESSLVEITGKRSHVNFIQLEGNRVLWIWKKITLGGSFVGRIKRKVDADKLSRISSFDFKVNTDRLTMIPCKVQLDEKRKENLLKQFLSPKGEVSGCIGSESSGLKFKSQNEVALLTNECLVFDEDFYKWTKLLMGQMLQVSLGQGALAAAFNIKVYSSYGNEEILEEVVGQTVAGVVEVLRDIKSSTFQLDVFSSEQSRIEVCSLSNIKNSSKLANKSTIKSGMKILLTHALGSGTVRQHLDSREALGVEVERLIRTSEERDPKLLKILKLDSIASIFPIYYSSLQEIILDVCRTRSLQFCVQPEAISSIAQIANERKSRLPDENIEELKSREIKKRGIERGYEEFFSTQWCSGFLLVVRASEAENIIEALEGAGFHDAACLGDLKSSGARPIIFNEPK